MVAAHSNTSQEIVGYWLLGGDASGLLWRCFKYDELPLQMLVQLQDGGHVTAPDGSDRDRTGWQQQYVSISNKPLRIKA